MPGLVGDQLALRLWHQNPTLPIIFMSGYPPETLGPEITLELGKNFVRKPFTITDLLNTIREKLAHPC